jgi:DNA primase
MDYDTQLIKDSIDIVEYIGRYADIREESSEFVGLCPFHAESTPSFTVSRSKRLWYCFGCGLGGDVIDFAELYHNYSFTEAVSRLADELGVKLPDTRKSSETMKFIRRIAMRKQPKARAKREFLPESILSQYESTPIEEWWNEGISAEILSKYQVMFDRAANRIVFPLRDENGGLAAIKGRTLNPDYKALRISKYVLYNQLGVNDLLFGLWLPEKQAAIRYRREVIVFEGEKSVMKLDSWGILNSVSVATSSINETQADKLLSLRAGIVIAFDKDSAGGKAIKCKQVELLKRFTDVYAIVDTQGMLDEKDSPADKGVEVWRTLYSRKVRL